MEMEVTIPQILLNLIQTSNPNSCFLCDNPHTIKISKSPISKNLKFAYTDSFCQFLNLEIPEDMEQSLPQAAYCEKCLQLVLDVHFLRCGIEAYEQKLKSLKHETEQLLYGRVVKSESNPQDLHDAYESNQFQEAEESIFTNFNLEDEEYTNFVPLDLKPKLPKPESKPELTVNVKLTRSGRRVSKPKDKEVQLDPLRTSSGSELDDDISYEPFQETNDSSESEDSEFELKEPKSPLKNVSKSKYPRIQPRFTCLICNKSYYSQKCLYRHYATHHKVLENYKKTVPAEIIKYVENYLGSSKSRTAKASSAGSSKSATRFTRRVRAKVKQTPDKYKIWECSQCTEKFWRPGRLEAHILRDHLKEPPKLKCLFCSKLYYVQEFINNHYRSSHSEVELSDSQKVELDPEILELVMKSRKSTPGPHSRRKTFECEQCAKLFINSTTLKVHVERNHLNALPKFQCKLCPKLYSTQHYLKAHYRRGHGEADIVALGLGKDEIPPEILTLGSVVKPVAVVDKEVRDIFPCVICKKEYYAQNSLYRHYVSHWDELGNYKEAITPEILKIVKQYWKQSQSALSGAKCSEPPTKRSRNTKNTPNDADQLNEII